MEVPRRKTLPHEIPSWVDAQKERDFFEHRLRDHQSRREKADYILQNPAREKLVARAEDWPFVYFGDGKRPQFEW